VITDPRRLARSAVHETAGVTENPAPSGPVRSPSPGRGVFADATSDFTEI
jgi:hypothetical protein